MLKVQSMCRCSPQGEYRQARFKVTLHGFAEVPMLRAIDGRDRNSQLVFHGNNGAIFVIDSSDCK